MAKRYGQRPSRFIEGLNEWQALVVDLKAADAGQRAEAAAIKRAKAKR